MGKETQSLVHGGPARYFESLEILSAHTRRDSRSGRICHTRPSLFRTFPGRNLLMHLQGRYVAELHVYHPLNTIFKGGVNIAKTRFAKMDSNDF